MAILSDAAPHGSPDSTPRISVVIPAHNAAAYLDGAIRSVLAQTRPPAEIFVVDDGSSDGTADIAARYRPSVTLLTQPRSGVSRARNRAADQATGDWLAFLDADDEWLPEKLERQAASMDASADLVHCDRFNIGDLDGLPSRHSEVQPLIEGDVFAELLSTGNTITTSCTVVRRALFLSLGGFDGQLSHAEDWDLWLRVAAVSAVRAVHEPLVKYRLHSSSLSRATDAMNRCRLVVLERALDSGRGRALGFHRRRRALSVTLATNGWDAARHGHRQTAAAAYARALASWPFNWSAYSGLARQALGR